MSALTPTWNHSLGSIGSVASPWSRRSVASVGSVTSAASAGSILSIASAGSILSIASAGSILSIGSAGSLLSVGSAGSILSSNCDGAMLCRDGERMGSGDLVRHIAVITGVGLAVGIVLGTMTSGLRRWVS